MNLLRWLDPRTWWPSSPRTRSITVAEARAAGWLGSGVDVAGVPVNLDTALGVSAVFCADRVISEDLASLPMLVYQGHRLDDGAKPLTADPVTELLARPNPEMTGPVFWSQFQHNANVWGFGLAEIVRDGAGNPVELWPVASPDARIVRGTSGLVFEVPAAGGGRVGLSAEDVLFLPGFSPDGSVGFKLLHTARMTLGLAVAAQRFGAARFKNGLNPSGGIRHPGVLSDTARENMRASWRTMYGGPDAAGNPMLFEEGTEWVDFVTQHNDQLQLAQLMQFVVEEVARFFNISPVKLHALGRATWGNLETLNRDHVTSTLGPQIAKRDAEIDRKLCRPGTHCRHVVDRLLTADTSTRFDAWGKAIAGGWMTPNEARKREDMPPKAGGDELLRPLNQKPPGDDQAEDKPNGNPNPENPTPSGPGAP